MRLRLQLPVLALLFGLFTIATPHVHAQVADISYTVAPEGTYVAWSEDTGLSDGLSYGGRLGFGFGQFAELSGLYQRGTFGSDLDALAQRNSLTALANVVNPDVTMMRYGGALKLNVARGAVLPFLQVGTGILRLDPDGLDANETIYLEGGAGLQFSVADRYTLLLQAQNLAYRYTPAQLFLSADARDLLLDTNPAFETINVRNWAFSAGLQFYLGGREPGTYTDLDNALQAQLGDGLRGVRLPIEPFVGSVSFADALGFADRQRVAGLYTGLDLGPYVGLRAFYWRGLADESLTDFQDLQSYGGELRLRMAADRGNIQPFFALGGGYLDVLSGYAEETGSVDVEDNPYALAGVGVELPINSSLRFRASARALFLSEQDLDDLSQPQQVSTSFMYSAGLTFSIGRQGTTLGAAINERLSDMEERALTREEQLQIDVLRTQADLDSLRATLARQAQADSLQQAMLQDRFRTDSLRVDSLAALPRIHSMPATTRGFMQVPIPEEGEIYIRFGPPGGVRFNLPDSLQADGRIEREIISRVDDDLAATYADSVAVDAQLVVDSVAVDVVMPDSAAIGALAPEAMLETPADSASAQQEQDLRDEIDRLNARIRDMQNQQVDSLRADERARTDSLALLQEQQIQQDLRDEVDRLNLRIQTMAAAQTPADSTQQAELEALLRQALTDQARRDSLTLLEERKIQQDLRSEIESLRQEMRERGEPVPPTPDILLQAAPAATDSASVDSSAVRTDGTTTAAAANSTTAGFYYGGLDAFGGMYFGSFRPAVGVRAELRLDQGNALRFAPEAALALGSDVLFNLNLNALYNLQPVEDFQPYLGAGVGLVTVDGNNDAAFNVLVGAERAFASGRFFGEFMTLDFFDRNRIAVGYRLSY